MKPGEAPLTREQLQLAFRHLRRPGWPHDLDAALAHPLRGPCIRGLARNLSRAPFNAGVQRPHSLPVCAAPPVPLPPDKRPAPRVHDGSKLGVWSKPRGVDRKRAAANDFDEAA